MFSLSVSQAARVPKSNTQAQTGPTGGGHADLDAMSYMKLKKYLLSQGVSQEEVQAAPGKPSLLHLAKTKGISSGGSSRSAARRPSPVRRRQPSPEPTRPARPEVPKSQPSRNQSRAAPKAALRGNLNVFDDRTLRLLEKTSSDFNRHDPRPGEHEIIFCPKTEEVFPTRAATKEYTRRTGNTDFAIMRCTVRNDGHSISWRANNQAIQTIDPTKSYSDNFFKVLRSLF